MYRRISQRWVPFQPQPFAQRGEAPLAARRPAPRRWHLCAAGAGEAIAAAPTTRCWLGPRGAGNQLPIATFAATLLSCDAAFRGELGPGLGSVALFRCSKVAEHCFQEEFVGDVFDPNLCAGRIEKKSRPQVYRGWGAGMFGGVTFQLFNCFVVGLGWLENTRQ